MRFGNKVRMRHNSSCFQNFSTLRAKTKITFHTLFLQIVPAFSTTSQQQPTPLTSSTSRYSPE